MLLLKKIYVPQERIYAPIILLKSKQSKRSNYIIHLLDFKNGKISACTKISILNQSKTILRYVLFVIFVES